MDYCLVKTQSFTMSFQNQFDITLTPKQFVRLELDVERDAYQTKYISSLLDKFSMSSCSTRSV